MKCYIDYLGYLSENLAQEKLPALLQAKNDLLEAIKNALRAELGSSLPEPYAEFLGRANGYKYNGVVFFAIDTSSGLPELIRENKSLRVQNPVLNEYLVLGQSDLWHYAFHQPTSTYRALQVDALDEPYYIFEDFEDCISSALEETLELLDEDSDAED
jgi:hypothetical protein